MSSYARSDIPRFHTPLQLSHRIQDLEDDIAQANEVEQELRAENANQCADFEDANANNEQIIALLKEVRVGDCVMPPSRILISARRASLHRSMPRSRQTWSS